MIVNTKKIINNELNNQEQLIYDLIFSDNNIFKINLDLYCKPKARSYFRENIRSILKRSKIKVTCDTIINTTDAVLWKLELIK